MINDIIRYNMKDYKKAISTYMRLLIKSEDLIGIYQIGSIKTPGVSDIDFVIVLKDSLSEFNFLDYSIKNLSKKDQYLFMHEPFVLNYSQLKNIRSLFPIFNLKEIYWNKSFKKINLKDSDFKVVSEYFFLSYLLRGYYFKRNLKSLRLFLAVSSLSKYSLNMVYSMLGKKPNQDIEKMKDLFDYKKKNFKEISNEDLKSLPKGYNFFNKKIIEDYLLSLLKYNPKKRIKLFLKFFPKIVIFAPIKKGFSFKKLFMIFPIQIYERFNDAKFTKIKQKLIKYNQWIYKNNLENFNIFTVQYRPIISEIKRLFRILRNLISKK